MKEDISNDFPVCIRILGFGKNLKSVIDKLGCNKYVSACIVNNDMNVIPSDYDKIVIMLVDEYSGLLESVASTFYQAGVLTIMITSAYVYKRTPLWDSMTISPIGNMISIVNSILHPILRDSYISFDFNDFFTIFKDTHNFKVCETYGCGMGNRVENAIDCMPVGLLEDVANSERALITFSWNRNMQPPIFMSHFKSLATYLNRFPSEIDIIWTLYFEDELPTDRIKLSVILSGKKLKP